MSTPANKPSRSTARKVAAAPAPSARTAPARKKAVGAATQAAAPVASVPALATATPVNSTLAKAAKAAKPEKQRVKLVRDSFTMPQADFALVDILKTRAIAARRPAKKSELLRAGLNALAALTPIQLAAALEALTPIKTGRPKKGH